jgi:hypothetical protein
VSLGSQGLRSESRFSNKLMEMRAPRALVWKLLPLLSDTEAWGYGTLPTPIPNSRAFVLFVKFLDWRV